MRALAVLALLAAGPPALAQRSDITVSPSRERRGDAASPPSAQRGEKRARADPALERRRATLAREMIALGAELRREIVAGEAAALLARVPAAGLRCGGRVVPRAKVARDLRTPGAWLHDVLFARARGARGAPASLAEPLGGPREVAVVVSFREDAPAGPVGLPCIDYRSPGIPTPGAPFCFERRGGRWWFAESLYPCG